MCVWLNAENLIIISVEGGEEVHRIYWPLDIKRPHQFSRFAIFFLARACVCLYIFAAVPIALLEYLHYTVYLFFNCTRNIKTTCEHTHIGATFVSDRIHHFISTGKFIILHTFFSRTRQIST